MEKREKFFSINIEIQDENMILINSVKPKSKIMKKKNLPQLKKKTKNSKNAP